MTVSDPNLSEADQADADTLMQELLDAGFRYEKNGRVTGFGGMTDDSEGDDGDGSDDAGDDSDSQVSETGTDGSEPGDEDLTDDPTGGGSDQGQKLERGAHTGRLELRGTPLTETEADGLLHLRKLLIDHPDLAAQINVMAEAKLSGRELPPAAGPSAAAPLDEPPAPKLPDFIDPDDPVAVGLWNEVVELRKGQAQTQETVVAAVDQAGRAKVQADIGNAIDRFKAAHPDLDDDDIRAIRDHTSATVNIPGVMANFPGDAVEGLVRALEIGSMTDPITRDKVLGVRDDRSTKDTNRQRKLSALSGGGGTGQRRPSKAPKPATWNDVAARLAKELESLGETN